MIPSDPSVLTLSPPGNMPGEGGGASAVASEVARLANQVLASFPFSGLANGPLGHVEPSALDVGAGGASPSVVPPVPGPLHAAPIAAAPLPRESDLRNIPALLSSGLGLVSPVALVRAAEPAAATPYFLDIAGHQAPAVPPRTGPTAELAPLGTPSFDAPSHLPAASVPALPETPPVNASPGVASTGSTHPALASPSDPPATSSFTDVPSFSTGRGAAGPPNSLARSPGLFDAASIKRDFPILRERIHGRPLVWLDNAATTQKPQAVIDRVASFYERENSNVHRAAHTLAARATDAYEGARDKVRRFLNAPSPQEIVFARGATEAINLVAQSWGRRNVGAGDEVLITWLEHHANIVPWQQLCAEKGARLCVAPVDDSGQVILEEFERLLSPRTRLVALAHVSNALGTIVPAREMVAMAHRHGARVLVDGAQAVSHLPVDVQALDCDFYCFSGHKVFAPTGIGALFGKAEILQYMPPWQGGGNMIRDVTFDKTTYQAPPWRFEAGTGNIADAVGLGAALDYVSGLGLENISRYEHELTVYATERLLGVPGLRLIGTAPDKAGVLSFVLDGVRTEDVGGILDQEGIAVRSGHHCAQPILRRFGLESSVRASLAPYNTVNDVDALVEALERLQAGRPRLTG